MLQVSFELSWFFKRDLPKLHCRIQHSWNQSFNILLCYTSVWLELGWFL